MFHLGTVQDSVPCWYPCQQPAAEPWSVAMTTDARASAGSPGDVTSDD